MQAITITKGDTLFPINSVILIGTDPVDLSLYTVKVFLVNAAGTVIVDNLTTGVEAHPTSPFTASASTHRLTKNAHGLLDGQQIEVSSSGTLPGGLAASTRYYVVNRHPNSFQVSLEPGGAPVTITNTGSGTHVYWAIGSVQFDLQSANVANAGDFKLHFTLWDGSERQHVPYDGDTLILHIVAPSGV
jgi:hypothetical protein